MSEDVEFISVGEACRRLHVTRSTLTRYLTEDSPDHIAHEVRPWAGGKVRRLIRPATIDKWIREHRA